MTKITAREVIHRSKSVIEALVQNPDSVSLDNIDPLFPYFSNLLESGRLSKAAFATMRAIARELEDQKDVVHSALISKSGRKNRPKTLAFSFMNISSAPDIMPSNDPFKDINLSSLGMATHHFVLQPNLFFSWSKLLPINFSSIHVSERFAQRTKTPLDFAHHYSANTVFTGLVLISAFEKIFESCKEDVLPIVLPHKEGLFMGHIERSNPLLHLPMGQQATNVNGIFKKSAGLGVLSENDSFSKDWLPTCRIYLHTFVSNDMLFTSQLKMKDTLIQILDDPETEAGRDDIVQSYIAPARASCDDTEQEKFKARMVEFLKSSQWRYGVAGGLKHLPDTTYQQRLSEALIGFNLSQI